jgi:magnesium transporter
MIQKIPLNTTHFEWIDVEGPKDEDLLELKSKFDLPHLLVQDCLRPEHLPKFESTLQGEFLMLRGFDAKSEDDAISIQDLTRKIALFISPNRIVTIHRVKLPFLQNIQDKLSSMNSVDHLESVIHKIVLATIRSYEEPLSKLQDDYDQFEEQILAKRADFISTTKMYIFRRRMFVMKRILKQTEDALYQSREFWKKHPSLLQDLRENCHQIYYQLDEISDTFEHLFQLFISLNDQRANEVMKVLTVFSTILLPLNFLASFYGMNFTSLPGIESPYAVHILLFVMIVISIISIWYFNRRGWFRSNRN